MLDCKSSYVGATPTRTSTNTNTKKGLTMTEITGRLERWTVGATFTATNEYIIWGDCYEDSRNRFPDSTPIHTSGILLSDYPIDELKEGMIVKTRNSTYLLGKPFGNTGEEE